MAARYSSNGKLLLTGEYCVLHGALSLAVPVKYKQWLEVTESKSAFSPILSWNAMNNGKAWFNALFETKSLRILETSNFTIAGKLNKLLVAAKKINSVFLSGDTSFSVHTGTDFDINWGLGASSTLIVNLSRWAGIDPFELFFNTVEGSGYDIACAVSGSPILYWKDGLLPKFQKVNFHPRFHTGIYFIYLGRKQDTALGVKKFLSEKNCQPGMVESISFLTKQMLTAKNLVEFGDAMEEHEQLMSGLLEIPSVKLQFSDFEGKLKSLGAWGGDFMMAAWPGSEKEIREYFSNKGLKTVIPFNELVL
ncbi:MAG: hypothetical protein JXB00_13010 [Bacteroidales bacterium]|nr:hypothetical protein [Bacteroidales bacterium]